MDTKRLLLYFALAYVVFSLWTAWIRDYSKPPVSSTAATTQLSPGAQVSTVPPTAATVPTAPGQPTSIQPTLAHELITVRTDVLEAKIDPVGGTLVEANLLKYPVSQKQPNIPVSLLNTKPDTFYVAEGGITGPRGPDTLQGQVKYSARQSNFVLATGQNELNVDLMWQDKNVDVTKTYHFKRNDYAVDVIYNVKNHSGESWSGNLYGQLRRKPQPSPGLFHFSTYTGGSISSPEKPYQKVSYSKMAKEPLSQNIHGGWLAMQQQYFLSAWIPNQQLTHHYYSSVDANNIYTLGFIGPTFTLAPGQQLKTTTTLYVGPEIEERLKALAPGLDLTIDFGWLWWLSIAILWVMKQIYKVVGNWGWAIVIVTLLIKLMFYKFSEMSYRSMAKMRQLQPKLAALKERYGDDKQKMSQATMELYRKEKVNPLGGCLPILIQIPVFIALYYVLIESVELRQAPFILWIHDLSSRDPYYVLPILMGISMFFQQRLNPTPPDPMQARVMQLLPLIFTILFATFPAGLVLYWLTNNVLSILQQWHITRRLEAKVEQKIEKVLKHKK